MADFFTVGPAGGSGSGGIGTLITPSGNGASDTAALQDAYDNAVANKTPLYLGGGTWTITSPITQTYQTASDYVPQIYGSGPGNTILVNGTGGGAIFHLTQSANFTYGFGGALRNMTLKGNGTTGELAIRMRGTWNFTFYNVYFDDFTGGDYTIWYDQPWVVQSGDETTNANHVYELCRWSGNSGDCIYCGESDDTTYTVMAYLVVRACRAIDGASFYRGGGRFMLFELNQFAYTTGYPCLLFEQEYSQSGAIIVRGNGFEGCSKGDIESASTGLTVENNRFGGVYKSGAEPTGNYDVIKLGNASNNCERADVRNNVFTYGELETSGGSRVYVNAINCFDCASVTIDKSQFPSVNGSTYTAWGHTKVASTDVFSFEISNAGRELTRARDVLSATLTDPGSGAPADFTGDMYENSYWHVVIGTEGSPPRTPAYNIANPTNSTVNNTTPGINSGCDILICIENNSGQTLSDSNFSWGTHFKKLALPSIPTGDRVFAMFHTGGRAITSSEFIWQTTDWVVH